MVGMNAINVSVKIQKRGLKELNRSDAFSISQKAIKLTDKMNYQNPASV